MEFHTTCTEIRLEEHEKLTEWAVPFPYLKLCNMIFKTHRKLYKSLSLDLYNPYEDATYETATHYILTWSAIEYFFYK